MLAKGPCLNAFALRYTYVLCASNIGLRHSHHPLLVRWVRCLWGACRLTVPGGQEVLDAIVKLDERCDKSWPLRVRSRARVLQDTSCALCTRISWWKVSAGWCRAVACCTQRHARTAPWLYSLLRLVIKPFVSSEVGKTSGSSRAPSHGSAQPLDKVVVYHSGYVEPMSRRIDEHMIPSELHGQCCCKGAGWDTLRALRALTASHSLQAFHASSPTMKSACLPPRRLPTHSAHPWLLIGPKRLSMAMVVQTWRTSSSERWSSANKKLIRPGSLRSHV